jgi:hypothetical protein
MAPPTSNTPQRPQNDEEWLSVADAAGRLGISTKTLRKRMAGGEVAFRRVVLARGGAAYEVEMESGLESEMERSKPMFQTDASKFQSDFQTEEKNGRNGSRNGTPSSVNRSGLETEMESSKPTSISTSKPMPESSKPALEMQNEVARLQADLEREREGAAFLRGVIEQLQRDGAETRNALREALKLAPKALSAPSPEGDLAQLETQKRGDMAPVGQVRTDSSARTAPERAQNGEVGSSGPAALEGAKIEAEGAKTGVSYGEIADELERLLSNGEN